MSELISVIVPVYNVEKYLDKCLNSLFNQSYSNIEIIAVNDCSTDSSLEILNSYSDRKNLKIINLEKNSGLSAVRNVGLEAASGDLISFVDSDDWLDEDFYRVMLEAMLKYDADVAVCGIKRVRNNRERFYLKFESEICAEDKFEIFRLCNIPSSCYVWNKLYKSSLIRENNMKFIEGVVYEDLYFTPELLFNAHKVVSVPNVYYYYRRRQEAITGKKSVKNENDYVVAQQWAEKFLEEHGIDYKSYTEVVHKKKLLGITVYKERVGRGRILHYLFNFIRWKTAI